MVESISGGEFYLVEVIAFILQYLKDQVIAKSQGGIQIKATDFDWVITVPAIWDARGKRMMREAAYLVRISTNIYMIIFASVIIGWLTHRCLYHLFHTNFGDSYSSS